MSFFEATNIAATGLTAQRLRMDVISQNIANINTTRTEDGSPYKRKITVFQEIKENAVFSAYLDSALRKTSDKSFDGKGVRVSEIASDETPGTRVYEPGHPDADEDGYVTMPNVNIVAEMVNMIAASRSYEANITAMTNTKAMIAKTLEIGK